jgi:peptide-methionine (S)-S-oxide reductase
MLNAFTRIVLATFPLWASACQAQAPEGKAGVRPLPGDAPVPNTMQTETATFGAGCFWCVEAVFQELNGVLKVESGYMGGDVPNPTYKAVCTGTTGHAEVTRITFDPSVITYAELLEILWTAHDPTTLNRQGADVGTQYRSAIFYHSDEQRRIAEQSKTEVATKIWDDPIVTEIVPAAEFFVAEDYHQNYYALNPNAGYCRIVISPKVEKVRQKYADKLKKQ